jgi:hypothetical protein
MTAMRVLRALTSGALNNNANAFFLLVATRRQLPTRGTCNLVVTKAALEDFAARKCVVLRPSRNRNRFTTYNFN